MQKMDSDATTTRAPMLRTHIDGETLALAALLLREAARADQKLNPDWNGADFSDIQMQHLDQVDTPQSASLLGRVEAIGANGNGNGGDDDDDDDDRMRPPPRKRARISKQEQQLRSLLTDVPDDALLGTLFFVLRPHWPPEYNRVRNPRSMRNRWSRNSVERRQVAAIQELKNLVRAFAILGSVSRRVRQALYDPALRVNLYRDWFLQTAEPLWLNASWGLKVPGNSFLPSAVDDRLAQRIPYLQPDIRSDDHWYEVFLADTFFNWYYGQYVRSEWKRMFVWQTSSMNEDDDESDQLSLDDNLVDTSYQLWPGVDLGDFYPALEYNLQREVIRTSSGRGVHVAVPGQLSMRVVDLTGTGRRDFATGWRWLRMPIDRLRQSLRPAYRDFVPDIALYATLSLLAVTIIRVPVLEVGVLTELAQAVRELSDLAVRPARGANISFGERGVTGLTQRTPIVFFDPPLQWLENHDDRRVFAPAFSGLTLDSVILGDMHESTRVLSLMMNRRTRTRTRLRRVVRVANDNPFLVLFMAADADQGELEFSTVGSSLFRPEGTDAISLQLNLIYRTGRLPWQLRGYALRPLPEPDYTRRPSWFDVLGIDDDDDEDEDEESGGIHPRDLYRQGYRHMRRPTRPEQQQRPAADRIRVNRALKKV